MCVTAVAEFILVDLLERFCFPSIWFDVNLSIIPDILYQHFQPTAVRVTEGSGNVRLASAVDEKRDSQGESGEHWRLRPSSRVRTVAGRVDSFVCLVQKALFPTQWARSTTEISPLWSSPAREMHLIVVVLHPPFTGQMLSINIGLFLAFPRFANSDDVLSCRIMRGCKIVDIP